MSRPTRSAPACSAFALLASSLVLGAGCDRDPSANAVGYCDPTGCYACTDGTHQNCWPLDHDRCESDGQCRAAEVCTSIGCCHICRSDTQCQAGEHCTADGYCAPRGVDVGPPASGASSQNSQNSQNGMNNTANPSGKGAGSTGCQANRDCPAGQLCNAGVCAGPTSDRCGISVALCNTDGQCGAGRLCRAGMCHAACAASSDCPNGQGCASGACVDGVPAKLQCLWDTDCGAAAHCINATCHPLCANSAQCQGAEFCDSGVCRADFRPAR